VQYNRKIKYNDEINRAKDIYTQKDKDMVDLFEKLGNKVMTTDPGFIDLKKGNLQLKKDSPAFKLGFKKIPIEKIGLYKDEYRKNILKD